MEERDLASNLEFWSGRTRGADARHDEQPLRSFRRRSFGRARPVAAAALLAVLAAGWLVAGHRSHASAEVGAPVGTSTTTRSTTTTVPRADDCTGLSPEVRTVRCVVDGVDLDRWLYSLGTVSAAYRRAAAADGTAHRGPPACARGIPDERAWSVASFPEAAVGRYRCRFEHGRAAMWWTYRDRLEHAVAPHGDLAALFSWWRAHPSE